MDTRTTRGKQFQQKPRVVPIRMFSPHAVSASRITRAARFVRRSSCTFSFSTRLASLASCSVLARPRSTPFSRSTSSVMPMFDEMPARILPLRLSSRVTIERSTRADTSKVFHSAREAYRALACGKGKRDLRLQNTSGGAGYS